MEYKSKKIGLRLVAGFLVTITIIILVFVSGIKLHLNEDHGIEIETGKLNIFLKDALMR